jgi:hypothetical protein
MKIIYKNLINLLNSIQKMGCKKVHKKMRFELKLKLDLIFVSKINKLFIFKYFYS